MKLEAREKGLRTAGFGPVYIGSNPVGATKIINV